MNKIFLIIETIMQGDRVLTVQHVCDVFNVETACKATVMKLIFRYMQNQSPVNLLIDSAYTFILYS